MFSLLMSKLPSKQRKVLSFLAISNVLSDLCSYPEAVTQD